MAKHMKKFKESLVKALLPHIILTMAQEQPIYGYQLIRYIRKAYGVYLGASTVYPVLRDLERAGLLTSAWQTDAERPRKAFTSTSAGREELLNETTTLALLEVKTT